MERRSSNYALFIGTLSILGVMVFSPQPVFSQEELEAPSILPDSPLYGLKLAIENIRETFTFQEERKAELILKHSEERDREAIELERQGKSIPLERLKEIQSEKLRRAEQIILKLEREQNIIKESEQRSEERRELAQATNEEERIAIQMQQKALERAEDRTLIEPKTGMGLIEPETQRPAEKPIIIKPVEDIKEADEPTTIVKKLRDRLENSFSKSEITEIRAKFAELRQETDQERKILLAEDLDRQVNNPMVSITCFGAVKTLSIAQSPDPVKELQNQCPILKPIPAEQLLMMASDLG